MDAPNLKVQLFADHTQAFRLLQMFAGAGEEARIVGGAIRNALMDQPFNDMDVATTALPEQTMALAAGAGWKTVPTGIAHGTVTVIIDGQAFEVTTLREDIATDGRRAVVRFGRDFKADALRRDFTINALSVGIDGQIHDYADGLADIKARKVRFIGDAATRIREDYLRILRFLRFSAAYAEGALDADGMLACIEGHEGLGTLSRERVGNEVRKWLIATRAGETLAAIELTPIPNAIFHGPLDLLKFNRLCDLETSFGFRPAAIRRIAALCVRRDGDIERLRHALKLSNREHDRLLSMLNAVRTIDFAAIATEVGGKQLIYRFGSKLFQDALMLRQAEMRDGAPADWLKRAFSVSQSWSAPQNPFKGTDFISLGLKPGAELGEMLRLAEEKWILRGFPSDEAIQKGIIRECVPLPS